jgi:hypothetical protein
MTTDNTALPEEGVTPQATEVEAQPATPPAETGTQRFTQEEVNRMVGQARREVRGQFSDYGDLKTRAARADELEQAQLTEAERLTQRATEAEKQTAEANTQLTNALISSEVKVKAVQLGIVDPDAAYLLLDKRNVKYDANDGVTGVEDALTQLLEDKPYLKGAAGRIPNINPEGGQAAPALRLTADQQEAARLMGMTEEEYSQGL